MTFPKGYRTADIVLAEEPVDGWGLRGPLEALGHRVLGQADEGQAALVLIDRLNPDLLVMDVRLHGLSGLEAAARAQARRRRALVLMAAEWDVAGLDAAVAAGALSCLVRPVRVEQLGLSIQTVLAQHAELLALGALRAELEKRLAASRLAVQAKGILMRRLGVGETTAHLLLHRRARRTRQPVAATAEEVIAADCFFAELEHSLKCRPGASDPPDPADGPGQAPRRRPA